MASRKATKNPKKHFSPAEANAMLPLVRAIVTDIVTLAKDVHERQERIARVQDSGATAAAEAYTAELQQALAALENDHQRLLDLQSELEKLGIELKDYLTGLVDFPSWQDGRSIYLCWRLGEPTVAHWHELDAGFAGRRKLMAECGALESP
jgi:hypothetical protein